MNPQTNKTSKQKRQVFHAPSWSVSDFFQPTVVELTVGFEHSTFKRNCRLECLNIEAILFMCV